MIAVCPQPVAAKLVARLGERNVKAWELGSVVESDPAAPSSVLWQ